MNNEEQIALLTEQITKLWRKRIDLLNEIEHLEKLIDKIRSGEMEDIK